MSKAKALTASEIKHAINVNKADERHGHRNATLVAFGLYTGCRIGEIVGFKIGDVYDTATGHVKEQFYLEAKNTKNKKGRFVFCNKKLKAILTDYIAQRGKVKDEDALFLSQSGTNFSANSGAQLMKKCFKKAGIDGASAHSTRRTFITKLAQKGVGVRELMVLAGHSSVAVTMQYVETNDERLKASVNLL